MVAARGLAPPSARQGGYLEATSGKLARSGPSVLPVEPSVDRPRFEFWRRSLARVTLIWVCLFGAYTLGELLSALRRTREPAAVSTSDPQSLDTHRLLNQVLAFTMMPIASFALYHFVVTLLARRVTAQEQERPDPFRR